MSDLKRRIAQTEVQITNLQKEVDYWTAYKDQGQYQHKTQIRTLEGEIEDMTHSFNEMKGSTQTRGVSECSFDRCLINVYILEQLCFPSGFHSFVQCHALYVSV